MTQIRIDLADKLFSLWIRNRDKWTCQRCHKKYEEGSQGLHNSHFWGRGRESTRFEPDNCCALDFGCHQYFTSNPAEHSAWQLKRLGQDRFDSLMLQAHSYKKKDRAFEVIKWTTALKQDFDL